MKIDRSQLIINSFIGGLLVGIASFFFMQFNVVFIAAYTLSTIIKIDPSLGSVGYHVFMVLQAFLIAYFIGVVFSLIGVYRAYLVALIVVPVTLFAYYFLYFSLGSAEFLANIFSSVLAFIISFCLFLFIIFFFYQNKK